MFGSGIDKVQWGSFIGLSGVNYCTANRVLKFFWIFTKVNKSSQNRASNKNNLFLYCCSQLSDVSVLESVTPGFVVPVVVTCCIVISMLIAIV